MLGFGFLYAPIVLLVLYSFNASRLVTVWAGFSTRWYGALFENEAFGTAALTSLEVAASAATLSLVLGTCAGFSMARFARFPGRLVFGFALLAPLVVPEVILGLSLLLLFVTCESWFGWPSRGMLTITIAHATFGACFVSVLVRAPAGRFRPRSRRGRPRPRRPSLDGADSDHASRNQRGSYIGLAPGIYTVARRSGDRELCHRPVRDDLADGGIFERAPGREPGGQRARDIVSSCRLRISRVRRLADGAGRTPAANLNGWI
jgi:hypothetical protein